MATSVLPRAHERDVGPTPLDIVANLRPNITWPSYEAMRLQGAKGLQNAVTVATYAELFNKGDRYVICNRATFDALYGLAQDVRRLQGKLLLFIQAAEVVYRTKDESAINLLHALAVQMPTLEVVDVESLEAPPFEVSPPGDEDDLDFELDAGRVDRAPV